jgi:transcriptional regulator of acetoin/glycerol metabolism
LTLPDTDAGSDAVFGSYLVLGIECARPAAGASRYSLAGIGEVRIGRGDERRAQRTGRVLVIEVPDDALSLEHVRLVRDRTGWTVHDASSKNGTHINGARAVRQELQDGDTIEAGRTFFVLRIGSGNADPGDLVLDIGVGDFGTVDPQLATARTALEQVARADVPMLILGETGTGKEIAARAVHELSRRKGHYVAVNCGAIAPTLVESELFGYRRGAFSGATDDRLGLVRTADAGTLFLDEIAELPLESQAALLRVIQEREVIPVGGTSPLPVDFRVVSATCQDPAALVALGRFRRDLHARIAAFTVTLPALRHRREDLGLLITRLIARRAGRAPVRLDRRAVRMLFQHDWPENIRELDQLLAAALALGDGAISAARIAQLLAARRCPPGESAGELETPPHEIDRGALSALLESHRGNVSRVAHVLRTSRSHVRRLAGRFGLALEQFRR